MIPPKKNKIDKLILIKIKYFSLKDTVKNKDMQQTGNNICTLLIFINDVYPENTKNS